MDKERLETWFIIEKAVVEKNESRTIYESLGVGR